MGRQIAGVEVVRAVHVAFRIEPDDRPAVEALGHHRRLADDLVDVVPRPDWSSHFVTSAAVVCHNAGVRLDPPHAARKVLGNEVGLSRLGQTDQRQHQTARSGQQFRHDPLVHELWLVDSPIIVPATSFARRSSRSSSSPIRGKYRGSSTASV